MSRLCIGRLCNTCSRVVTSAQLHPMKIQKSKCMLAKYGGRSCTMSRLGWVGLASGGRHERRHPFAQLLNTGRKGCRVNIFLSIRRERSYSCLLRHRVPLPSQEGLSHLTGGLEAYPAYSGRPDRYRDTWTPCAPCHVRGARWSIHALRVSPS